ncbi:hypothetical protein AJ80_08615 [Polytolypa hystricis UAMH7299]|uniref:Uncharacterized protein n=1 Tax=Polytolypa hystricis (strain UAMH7299) TaxID=1447883 RepID=A0A2B7X553_POLH7|nr:hypothetical protein AJ80_08615 [Polytolypa hystricis UAMH7299]
MSTDPNGQDSNPQYLATAFRAAEGKLEFYASPPISPPANRPLQLDPSRGGNIPDHLKGMDGDSHQRKNYEPSSYQSGSNMRPSAGRHSSSSSADRFRQPQQPQSARAVGESAAPYGGYGYTESPAYSAPSLQGGSLQTGGLQYQSDFSSVPSRQSQPQVAEQQSRHQQRLSQYEPDMVYNIAPQAQSPYEAVSQYQPRQSAAIEVLANQFGVAPYFAGDDAGTAVSSQYLTTPSQQAPFSQSTPASRPSAATTFSENMAGYNPPVAAEGLEAQEFPRESSSNFDDAYNQYQRALRQTFENTRVGRLTEASQSLLEISEWLLSNAVELGLVRDEEELHADRIKLWNEFNTCWLAVCQKQKDMTEEMLQPGGHPQNILPEDILNKMGRELVRLCDRMEQYGLVDYQMGVWEEEILSVLGECLDLLEENYDGEKTAKAAAA